MQPNLFAGMGSHQSAKSKTDTWLSPLPIVRALGRFDLDPCAAPNWPTADQFYFSRGLQSRWFGRVWLNPPYSRDEIGKWIYRLREHNKGTALVFARTETKWCFDSVWGHAAAVLFVRGRLTFHLPDGRPGSGNAGAPSMLVAYGGDDRDRLAASGIRGEFILLANMVYSVLQVPTTWVEVVANSFGDDKELSLPDLYHRIEGHPKTASNQHWHAKIRQTVQRSEMFRSERKGYWIYDGID